MVERPILFSGQMVRAIFDGKKTQTRRIVKRVAGVGTVTNCEECDMPGYFVMRDRRLLWNSFEHKDLVNRCPYGQVGDVLWVKEAFALNNDIPVTDRYSGNWIYRADYSAKDVDRVIWKPSIHMPRAASRILLKITGIRVERLQCISDFEAKCEGIPSVFEDGVGVFGCKLGFIKLWERINGAGSWSENPVVWVICFRRMRGVV